MAKASRTADFISSLGVNTHIYVTGSSYWDAGAVVAELQYLGISQVRDEVVSNINSGQGSYTQLAAAGIHFDMVFTNAQSISDQMSALNSFVQANAGAVIAVEGLNEIDNTPVNYDGLTGLAAAAKYQSDLFSAAGGDSLLSGVSIYNFTEMNSATSGAASAGNVHVYPHAGAEPLSALQSALQNEQAAMPGAPTVLSELGYSTYIGDSTTPGVDQITQAKLTLNALMDATKLGYQQIFLYQLMDGGPAGSTDGQDYFGLFTNSDVAKTAATAIHNLTSILADTGAQASTFTTGSLNYTVSGLPATGSSMLMEKSSGVYDLVLWNEPQIWNASTNTEVTAAAAKVTVNLGASFGTVDVYDPTTGTTPISETHNAGSVSVSLTDHPLIIQVSTAATSTAVANTPMTITGPQILYGGPGDDYLSDAGGARIMNGEGGKDTFVVSNSSDQIIEPNDGNNDTVLSSVSFVAPTNIQTLDLTGSANLTGTANNGVCMVTANSGNDTLIGGSGASTLMGGAGYDTLKAGSGTTVMVGGVGADTMIGGLGNNTFKLDNPSDTIQVQAGAASNVVWADFNYTAPTGVTLVVLTGSAALTAYANDGNIVLQGGAGADTLIGGAGTGTLVGGSGATTMKAGTGATTFEAGSGVTTMIGGSGNAYFEVNNTADVVTAQANGGHNIIQSSVSYTASANVNCLELTGAANLTGTANGGVCTVYANSGNDTLIGGSGTSTLIGGAGYDTLKASSGTTVMVGGVGSDVMIGGLGNNTFKLDNPSDTIQVQVGAASNVVLADFNYTALPGVTQVVLTGSSNLTAWANNGAIVLEGGAGADTLIGGAGTDTLVGGSGATTMKAGTGATTFEAGSGVATMIGGSGSAYFEVNNTADVVTAQANGGHNIIQSSVSYTASANVDTLELSGSANLTGTANSGDCTVYANSGNDTLIGGAGASTLIGGAGTEIMRAGSGSAVMVAGAGLTTMIGGMGSNIFKVDNTADVIQLQTGAASNVVQTTVSYAAQTGVTQVVLTGAGNLTATANGGTIVLEGGSGSDTLIGGAGSDTLIAGSGATTMKAGSGNTIMEAGGGVTTMIGGSGHDNFQVNSTADVVTAQANGGYNTVQSTVSYVAPTNVTVMTFTGAGAITGTANGGNLTMTANSGTDTLIAGAGVDSFYLGSGTDTVISGSNQLVVNAGSGHAIIQINSLAGAGTLTHPDTVTGFSVADGDVIDLRGLAATLAEGASHATLLGTGAFTGVAGQLHETVTSAGLVISGDMTGAGVADFSILLQHVTSIGSANLLW